MAGKISRHKKIARHPICVLSRLPRFTQRRVGMPGTDVPVSNPFVGFFLKIQNYQPVIDHMLFLNSLDR